MSALQGKNLSKEMANENSVYGIGSLKGQDLIDADYDIDECNDEIAEMFGVME